MKTFAVGIIVIAFVWILVVMSFWASVIYTAAHFISKLW